MSDDDPYRHHPELRGQIDDPETSFLRTLNTDLLRQMAEEHNLPAGWWYADEVREGLRAEAMKGRWDRDLWVFAYGSLMWDPGIRFAEVRRARIEGYSRQFILVDSKGGRGTEEAPGLFAALDTGPCCEGLGFRIRAEDLEEETRILWQREQIEPGYLPVFLPAAIGEESVTVLAFVADHSAEVVCSDLTRERQVAYIASGTGIIGTSADYLRGIVTKLDLLGLEDEETRVLLGEVERSCAGSAGRREPQ